MKKTILAALLLSGCVQQSVEIGKPPKAYMFGDSLCNGLKAAATIGYEHVTLDCMSGRKLVHFPTYLPSDITHLFLSGGTNDTSQRQTMPLFEERVRLYTDDPRITVICILPNELPDTRPSSEPYRDVLKSYCNDYIDPVPDCGVQILHEDGIHYHQSDRDALGQCILDKLYDYGIITE